MALCAMCAQPLGRRYLVAQRWARLVNLGSDQDDVLCKQVRGRPPSPSSWSLPKFTNVPKMGRLVNLGSDQDDVLSKLVRWRPPSPSSWSLVSRLLCNLLFSVCGFHLVFFVRCLCLVLCCLVFAVLVLLSCVLLLRVFLCVLSCGCFPCVLFLCCCSCVVVVVALVCLPCVHLSCLLVLLWL